MKSSGIVIIISVILSLALVFTGTYLVIDNLFHPQGYLFEGIVLGTLGLIVSLMLVIASNLGRAIQIFTDVYTQQTELQLLIKRQYENMLASKPRSISDILSGLQGDGNSVTITNLETGETSTKPLEGFGKLNEMILSAMTRGAQNTQDPKDPKEMNQQQLERELAKAVKKDDFERANEIKELLQKLKNNGDSKKDD